MSVGRPNIIAAAWNDAFRAFGKRGPFAWFWFGSRRKFIVDENIYAVMANQVARHAQYPLAKDLRLLAKMGVEQFRAWRFKKYQCAARRGEILIQPGDLNYNLHAVLKGLVRTYTVLESGDEKTLVFTPERKRVGSVQTVIHGKPAEDFLEVLEPTVAVVIDIRKFDAMASENVAIMKIQRDGMRETIEDIADRLRFYTVLSPEQRYAAFCRDFPNLEQRVKQKHLASYLGVTPQSLSRMRARIVNK